MILKPKQQTTPIPAVGRLMKGTCRCVIAETEQQERIQSFSTRRRRQEPKDQAPKEESALPVVTAILVPDNETSSLWMCRWSNTGRTLAAGKILCFQKSVSIHGIDNEHATSPSELLSKRLFVRPATLWSAWECEKTSEAMTCSDSHAHCLIGKRQVLDESSSVPLASGHLWAISGPPVPLQSLVIVRVTGRDAKDIPPVSPLQQASWKRQLVGSILLYSAVKYTSTLQIGDDEDQKQILLTVASITARYMSAQNLYIVLPSTRISLQSSTSASKHPSPDPDAPTGQHTLPLGTSPVTRLLLHVVHCMHQNIPVPRTFLLSGPAGVGKTHAVRQTLNLCPLPLNLVSLRGSEILRLHSNSAQALELEFQRAASTGTGEKKIAIVFLDECDALVSVASMAAMLATLLDKVATKWTHLLVVGATNRIDSLPDYLRRAGRFDKEIPLTPPNANERAEILSTLLREAEATEVVSSQACRKEIQRIAELCVGYVAADLNALLRKASLLATARDGDETSSVISCLEPALSDVGPSALRDAALSAPPKITWDDIAGDPGGAKTALRQAIEWPRTKAESFARLGLIPPRGILLHGPPGCAKTTLARAAAGASAVSFLSLSPAEVYSSSYVGEAEAVVRRAFSLARSATPCVLFFDEMDSIFGGVQDGGRGGSAEARVLSTFLNEMDGIDNHRGRDGVLVLGATNRPWTLDSALLRPGRLGDKIIYIPPPDAAARRNILEMQFGKSAAGMMDLDELASDSVTGLMTGAELVGACQEAKLRLLRDTIESGNETESALTHNVHEILYDVLRSTKPLLSDPAALKEFRVFEQSVGGH